MDRASLSQIASSLVADHRGILAADESTPTMTKRLDAIGVKSTDTSRRDYRETLFTAPGLGSFVSGVILYDETLRQKAADGTAIPELLASLGIHPGIKVDTGAMPFANHEGEKITEGLDGLRGRLAEYAVMGAKFAKWRAVITIGADGRPSDACVHANAHALARYAALCQEAGIVPIVEPEVLMDGDHDIDTCERVTGQAWKSLFAALHDQDVYLPGVLLKPSMVISGKSCATQADAAEVAKRTVALLRAHVPAAVPGVVFLSGGQTPEQATEHLALMNQMGPHPWALSFSYGRALQEPALAAWAGDNANRPKAQAALLARAEANSAACSGRTETAPMSA